MTRSFTTALSFGILVSALAACGTTAPDPNPPGDLPHGGTGEFRALTSTETGISGIAGLALAARKVAIESAAGLPDGPLFYGVGVLLEEPPDEDPALPEGDVDWTGYEPRIIRRAASREGEELGFIFPGVEVLAATEAWEMGEVFSPWPVLLSDGRLRLYYASPGGIGVAEAPSVDGALVRVGGGPIVATVGGEMPRRPTVVQVPDGDSFLLYYEVGGHLVGATSTDGLSFTAFADPLVPGAFVPRDDDDPAEVALGGPGAIRFDTGVGRQLIRLYFESRRDDGTRLLMMSGSTDGMTFERYEVPVVGDEDRRDPAPIQLDLRTTLMYLHGPRQVSSRQGRGVLGTVAPRSVVLVAEPDAGI
ncbi:MAG: hypothetical protein JRH11_08165 [Deltaproteobacteria bacterium]|nr:hypothetical protein [Deltaproteobacteria bacterium]